MIRYKNRKDGGEGYGPLFVVVVPIVVAGMMGVKIWAFKEQNHSIRNGSSSDKASAVADNDNGTAK